MTIPNYNFICHTLSIQNTQPEKQQLSVDWFTRGEDTEVFAIFNNTDSPLEHAYVVWAKLVEVTRGSFTRQRIGVDQYRALQCLFFLEQQEQLDFSQVNQITLWDEVGVSCFAQEFYFASGGDTIKISIGTARNLILGVNKQYEPQAEQDLRYWVPESTSLPSAPPPIDNRKDSSGRSPNSDARKKKVALFFSLTMIYLPSFATGVMWMLAAAGMGGAVFTLANPFMWAAVGVTVLMLLSMASILYGFKNDREYDAKQAVTGAITFTTMQSVFASGSGVVTGIFLLALSVGTATFSLTNPVMWATVGLAVLCVLCRQTGRYAPKIAQFFSQKPEYDSFHDEQSFGDTCLSQNSQLD